MLQGLSSSSLYKFIPTFIRLDGVGVSILLMGEMLLFRNKKIFNPLKPSSFLISATKTMQTVDCLFSAPLSNKVKYTLIPLTGLIHVVAHRKGAHTRICKISLLLDMMTKTINAFAIFKMMDATKGQKLLPWAKLTFALTLGVSYYNSRLNMDYFNAYRK